MLGRRKRVLVDATAITPGANRRLVRVGNESRELVPLPGSLGDGLYWRQPNVWERVYYLESAHGAHLVVEGPPSVFASDRKCTMAAVSGTWQATLKLGWGLQKASVTGLDGQEVMRFEPAFFTHGKLITPDGSPLPFRWTWTGHELRDEQGITLFSLRHVLAWFRSEAEVHVSPEGQKREDLLVLLGLTWIMLRDESRRRR